MVELWRESGIGGSAPADASAAASAGGGSKMEWNSAAESVRETSEPSA